MVFRGVGTIAIAISYFDRQTLPAVVVAIQHDIPHQQFAYLQSAFLISYASLYLIGGRLMGPLNHCLSC
jgi:ACS family hexuronate transporter-like MFS transporter